MRLTTIALQPCNPSLSPNYIGFRNSSGGIPTKPIHSCIISRRLATIAAVNTILLAQEALFNVHRASAFDFRLTVPDQTAEEAQGVIRDHAEDLLQVKDLLKSESWRDAQKALRKSSSLLKQDIYTLIQAKPGVERPQLRTLYSQLFNNVTSLDYAARSKDTVRCMELFDNIKVSLDAILSRIYGPTDMEKLL